MERGRLVESGEAESLCAHPREAYTRQLIAATPELPVVQPSRSKRGDQLSIPSESLIEFRLEQPATVPAKNRDLIPADSPS